MLSLQELQHPAKTHSAADLGEAPGAQAKAPRADVEIIEDPDAEVEMNYGSAAEAHTDSMSSMYEPNTESQSTVAGSDEPPTEDQPVEDATEEDISNKIFHVCTTNRLALPSPRYLVMPCLGLPRGLGRARQPQMACLGLPRVLVGSLDEGLSKYLLATSPLPLLTMCG